MENYMECLQAYEEYLMEREMSENTVKKYLRDVKALFRYLEGINPPDSPEIQAGALWVIQNHKRQFHADSTESLF